jgi:hypothetical protein
MIIRLILLGTAGCHLCEQALEIVNDCWASDFDLFIEHLDIADFPEWQAEYATRIPVLYHPETETDLSWPFTQPTVAAFIEALRHEHE